MGKLIDADELIERIIKDCNGFHPQGYHTCKYDIVGIINQCDTAYDVDKVVKQLEECSFYSEPTYDDDGYSNDDEDEVVDLWDAIEIVKAGGKE